MSIDAKGIQHLLWRIITFSGSCCYRYVRKYPVVSGFFAFIFFLYICFPLVFYYLMCSCPIIACTFVSIRFYLNTKYPKFQWIKRKNSDQGSYVDVNGSNEPTLRNLKSVRRNARMEVPDWDRKDIEEMNKFSPRIPYGRLFSNTNVLDGNSMAIFDEKGGSSHVETGNDRALDDLNSVSSDSFQGQSGRGPDGGGGGGSQVEVESTGEEEGVHDDGKKAIEWTEDDQNNVMVLGTLESERNQRLESLMAKRRARKLFKMAVDKSLMKMDAILPSHLAPIVTGASNDPYEEILRMPGSAPSIMIPTDNPFDLPYDPHEEKPNLMADSFQQEFMTTYQKEFCRHESFCRGTLLTRDPNDAQFNHYYSTQRTLVEGPTDPRFKWQSGNHNEAMKWKQEMIRERSMDGIGVEVEVEGEKMGSPSPHDLELRTDITRNNNDSCYTSSSEDTESVLDQTSKYPEIRRDRMRKAFNLLVPRKGKTVNTLPYDFSPSPSERPRPDFSLFYGTYKRNRPPSTCSIASDLQVEVSEIGSPPTITDGMVSSVDGDSVTYDGDLDRDINSDSEEVWGDSFDLSRGEANGEKLRELHDIIKEDSVDDHVLDSKTNNVASHPINMSLETHEDTKKVDEEVEGLKTFNVSDKLSAENPGKTEKPIEELSTICNVKPIIERDSIISDSNSSESRENGAELLIGSAKELKKPAEAINSVSSDYSHGNLDTSLLVSKKMEENQPSNYIEEDTKNLEPKHDTEDAPNAVQSRDKLIANKVYGSKQRFDGSIVMDPNRRLLIEQISDKSFSSPRSVLPQNNMEDEIPLSDVEKPQKNSTPENAQKLAENSIDRLSSNSSLGTLEGSSNTTDYKSADHMSKLALEDMQDKGNFSIQSSKSESKTLMSSNDNKELSRPSSETNPGFIEHLEGGSQKLVEHGTGIDPSKSEEKNAISDDPETMVVKEKEPSSSRKVNSVVNTKDERAVPVGDTKHEIERLSEAKGYDIILTSEGESISSNKIKNCEEIQNLTSHDGIIDAPHSKEDHKANETSMTTESEVKPVEPQGNGSNAVANFFTKFWN